MLRDEEVDEVIAALEAHYSDRLTVWECNFVASVRDRRAAGVGLTPGQKEKLDEIFERFATGRG